MSNRQITIAVDAMGGENSPFKILKGSEIFLMYNKNVNLLHYKPIQDKIFEPNFTTKNSGMGLGLAMVKNIIDSLNGDISYETSSIGTIFKIILPIIHLKNKNS